MNIRRIFSMLILAAYIISPQSVLAAEEAKAPQAKSTRSKLIFGVPVNVNIAGPGSMPEGVLYTAINTSFADKVTPTGNTKSSDVFSQTWLLKLRYGITDYLEVWTTTPYINNRRTNPEPNPQVIYGIGDTVLALTFGPWHERRGDAFTASASVGVWLPMAAWGDDHPPGLGVMGFRGQAAVGKFLTKDIKIETEGVWNTRFDRGNQNVRLGDQFQWNSQIRYLFDYFDIGVESSMVWQHSSDRFISGLGTRDLRNGYTEWFVGPSVNVAIEPLGMWAGIGAFFPVMRYTDSPTKVENVRLEFKRAKLW
jgi:hypothetical protein